MARGRKDPGSEDVTIGIVGADAFVHRIADVARSDSGGPHRLITAAYAHESEAREKALRIAGEVDVILFAGPLPYDIAMTGDPLPVPATFVPTGGVALPNALLHGAITQSVEVQRVSIDSVSQRQVRETYAELEVDTSSVYVMEYHESVTPDEFLQFHLEHYKAGRTSGAITTVPSVVQALREAEVPTLSMSAAPLTMRNALRTASLLGSGARHEDSRIAIVLVQLPATALPRRTSSSNYWYQELRLSLHRALLHDARRMDAAVLNRDEHGYLVITTLGSLRAGTDNLTRAPFLHTIATTLDIEAEVGIGLGRTTAEAEEHAQSAVNLSAERPGDRAYLLGPQGGPIALPARADDASPPQDRKPDQHDDNLRTLVHALAKDGESSRIVDAEAVAKLQGVTLRTARRTLHGLVQAGLAWPMPPARSQKVGRPPVRYQLLDERITEESF